MAGTSIAQPTALISAAARRENGELAGISWKGRRVTVTSAGVAGVNLRASSGSSCSASERRLQMRAGMRRANAVDTLLAIRSGKDSGRKVLENLGSDPSNLRTQVIRMAGVSTESVRAGFGGGSSFIRPHLRDLAPYTPIEPFEILSARLGRSPKDIVKLDANENPYGPPPEVTAEVWEVMEALGKMEFPNIYPDPESRRLRAALAEDSGLGAEHILVGCGADELIDLIMRCTLDPGDTILDFPPTFTMYAFDAAVNGANVIKVPRLKDFSLNMPQVLEAVERNSPKLIFVTSPNNPDGSLITEEHLLDLLKLPVLVVLDEAYIEFASEPSRMPWVKKFDNLIVLRTFSKRAGLAGIRVGYGAFPRGIIEFLWRAKQPYNVSVAAEVAACAALKNPDYLEDVKVALVNERERLFKLLHDVPFLTPYPSNSNFILCSVDNSSKSAKQLKADLAKLGVMVRHYDNTELRNYIRISVGRPEHTDAFFAALAKVS